ncbi:multiple epidermal growth factor-like domains protein 10, partial [Mercenaria mercenaria]|uniref:multiple epidermal growth factor-like domains protein 10 n=1 Tax=Mercenaria mercenaria TaxID=6596 RepID=UPI00234EE1C9
MESLHFKDEGVYLKLPGDNGFNDCRYRYCPLHCKCEKNACVSCGDGYFNVSSSCISKCPSTCVSCSAKDKCSSCREGKYNGYEFDMTDRLQLNNCTHGCRENCIFCSSYNNCSQCVLGKYGMTCQRDCSVGCENKICQIESGNCTCKINFSGRNCTDCVPGKFGELCEKTCPMFCKNKRCDKSSGNCLDGCILATIVGETCNACVNGSYGDVCNATCPNNCKDVNCERDNGECSYGCKDNFTGKKCEACKDGKYGYSCNLTCPQNCADDKCNKTSGHCFACSGNYYGNECNDCVKGYHGSTCNDECSPQCLNGVCNRATGNCDLGCKENYSGDKCCVEGGNCFNCSSNSECNKCKSGYFSEQCNKTCSSYCLDSCDFVTGDCSSCIKNMYGQFCNATCSRSCKISQDANSSRCEVKHGNCLHGCVDGFYGPNCSESCNSQCIDNLCMRDTGQCTNVCSSDDPVCTKSSGQKSRDSTEATGPIAGGVVGLIILVTVVIVVAFVYKRRQGKNESSGRNREMPRHTAREEHTYGNITENHSAVTSSSVVNIGDVRVEEQGDDFATNRDETYYNTEQNNNRVNVNNLLTYVTKEHVDSFENEFKKLNKGLDLTENCTFAKKPENIALNRYNGIYPYDHSRVTYPGQPDFFINACYIDGYNRRKAYIASLGPTAKTTDTFATFWSMVWNEKSDIILMLTNLREASGMKCEQYWPKVDTETLYGQIKAKCRSVEEYAEYTVRTFTIAKGQEQRNLLQLHYTTWPDKGVPQEVTSLVEFRQRVKAVPVTFDGPIIVHCSAGVGRTGTYIALDQLTEEGKCEGSVDVFNCVNRMREQRVNMVQTAEQYT